RRNVLGAFGVGAFAAFFFAPARDLPFFSGGSATAGLTSADEVGTRLVARAVSGRRRGELGTIGQETDGGHRLGAAEGGHLVVAGHDDRLLRAGVHAQAAHHAAQHVDVEAHGVLFDALVGKLSGLDHDALGRADGRAHEAGDALETAVRALGELVDAAEARRVGAALLRIGDCRLLPAVARKQVLHEVGGRDHETLDGGDHRRALPVGYFVRDAPRVRAVRRHGGPAFDDAVALLNRGARALPGFGLLILFGHSPAPRSPPAPLSAPPGAPPITPTSFP